MTRNGWICLIVLGLAGCTDGACDLDDLVDCADCSVRHAYATDTALASRGPVATCATCAQIWSLDTRTAIAKIDIGPRTEVLQVEGAQNGMLYVIADQAASPDDDFPVTTNRTLVALDQTNQVAWTMPIDGDTSVLAGLDGMVVLDGSAGSARGATAFDATGAKRWATPLDPAATVGPDGQGGLWVGTGGFSNQSSEATAEIRHLDATGAFIGSPVPVSVDPASGDNQSSLSFVAFRPLLGGGFVTGGWIEGSSLVFDGTKLDPPTSTTVDEHGFVAMYDASAKLVWAHVVDAPGGGRVVGVAPLADGRAVVMTGYEGASGIAGIPDSESDDVLVETWDASGMVTATRIGGAGSQVGEAALVPTDHDTVWASFASSPATAGGSSELTLNGDTIDGGGRYVVELQL